MGERPQKEPVHREPPHAAAKHMGAGLQFAGAIVLFVFAGIWVDGRFGLSPWGTIAGVAIGAVGGFYSLYTKLMADQRESDRKRREQKDREAR